MTTEQHNGRTIALVEDDGAGGHKPAVSLYGKNVAAGDTALLATALGEQEVSFLVAATMADSVIIRALRDMGGTSGVAAPVGMYGFNGAFADRWRANTDLTLLASAARTATLNSADQVNYNGRGLQLVVDVSLAGSGSITPALQVKDSISGNYKTIWTAAAALVANGTYVYEIYPSNLTAVGANLTFTEVVALVLGRTWRLTMTHNNANTITYSASGVTIL